MPAEKAAQMQSPSALLIRHRQAQLKVRRAAAKVTKQRDGGGFGDVNPRFVGTALADYDDGRGTPGPGTYTNALRFRPNGSSTRMDDQRFGGAWTAANWVK